MNSSPYENLPPSQFWRSGVTESNVLNCEGIYSKKYELNSSDKIASAGSCFAQHISKRLQSAGYTYLDYEPSPVPMSLSNRSKYGYGIYSCRYGNIYTTRQLLQLAQVAINERESLDYVWERDGNYFDPLRPSVEPEGLSSIEEVYKHRSYHLNQVLRLLKDMTCFVFTLGLTELWVCRNTNTALPVAPGTIAGDYDESKYEFINLSFNDVYNDFLSFMRIVWTLQGNRRCKFLLTVSPVSLTATATNQHVLLASTYSKSVLRAVAGELSSKFKFVDYYPSYEIITSPWSRGLFYNSNLRTVSDAGVDAAMRPFFTEHKPLIKAVKKSVESGNHSTTLEELDAEDSNEVVCEEALLEVFSNGK